MDKNTAAWLILLLLGLIFGIIIVLLIIRWKNFYAPLGGRPPRNKWERMYGVPVLSRTEQRREGAATMYGGWMLLEELPYGYPVKKMHRFSRCIGNGERVYPPVDAEFFITINQPKRLEN